MSLIVVLFFRLYLPLVVAFAATALFNIALPVNGSAEARRIAFRLLLLSPIFPVALWKLWRDTL